MEQIARSQEERRLVGLAEAPRGVPDSFLPHFGGRVPGQVMGNAAARVLRRGAVWSGEINAEFLRFVVHYLTGLPD